MHQCACGCGTEIPLKDKKGRIRHYVFNHFHKGKKWPQSRIEKIKGSNNSSWKGGIQKQSQGYVYVLTPDHPYSDSHGLVLEHRLVMEKSLGRYLTRTEHVHHKNGIRNDNRLENLELMLNTIHNSSHANMRQRDKKGRFISLHLQ